MSTVIRIQILFISFFFTGILDCQIPSFQITMDIPGHRLGDLVVNENDEIIALFYGPPNFIFAPYLYLMDLSNGMNSQGATQFHSFSGSAHFLYLRGAYYYGDKLALLQTLIAADSLNDPIGYGLVHTNVISGETWMRTLKDGKSADFVSDETGNLLVVSTPFSGMQSTYQTPDVAELFYLDTLGTTQWRKGLHFFKSAFTSFELITNELGYLPGSGYYLTGKFKNYNDTGLDEYFVMKLTPDGTPDILKTIDTHQISQLYVGNDGIYLLGKTEMPLPFTGNTANAVLAKFDQNLNLQWSKVYYGGAFEYSRATLSIGQDGTLALGYSTFGAFPVILAKLDSDGNILWQKGYPLYEPQIDALSDGSLLLATQFHFDETGDIFLQTIFAKTDTLGNIQDCEVFPTCLNNADIPLTMGTFEVDSFEIEDLIPLELEKDSAQFSFSDFCDIPPSPSPEFAIPDTICVGDSIWTSDANNVLAHQIKWKLTGMGIDSVQFDSTTFGYRFQEPGVYTLEQTVWFLGCGYSSEHSITVLDHLEVDISPSGILCDPPPAILHVNSNRLLTNFLWNTGDVTPELEISEGGEYAIEVSDGYCWNKDTISTTFLSEFLGGEPPFVLPPDTAVCEQDLPFLLDLQSPFAQAIILDDKPVLSVPIVLPTPGQYLISVTIEGCVFENFFQLGLDECKAQLYFPNLFSPNGDGINDVFAPQGVDFQPLRIWIYNRWGGLVAVEEGPDARWDGGNEQQGVYAYVFEYINTKTMKVERVEGTVTLVR